MGSNSIRSYQSFLPGAYTCWNYKKFMPILDQTKSDAIKELGGVCDTAETRNLFLLPPSDSGLILFTRVRTNQIPFVISDLWSYIWFMFNLWPCDLCQNFFFPFYTHRHKNGHHITPRKTTRCPIYTSDLVQIEQIRYNLRIGEV